MKRWHLVTFGIIGDLRITTTVRGTGMRNQKAVCLCAPQTIYI